ncbi:Protein kti12 [Escovopsis weberi]|uniref:Protein kti12 n=1 Tax=Escovopsis weberi TaxID=150374 RepID=A0A0M8MWY8_ESCWE|nr:Protein kti12 [Escovopsis weberi]
MPLIILTGYPTSGKSTRAKQLHDYLEERARGTKYRLHLVSDDALSISRSVYDLSALPAHTRSANASEKDARAAVYGAVKRVLSDRDIVILDGLNYIKGWRYQLHCEAKAVRTMSCILQIGCSPDQARRVNEERLRSASRTTTAAAAAAADDDDDQDQGGADQGDAAADDNKNGEGQEDSTAGRETRQRLPEPYQPANWENLVFRHEEPNPMTRWDSPLFTLVWDDGAEQTRRTFDSMWDAIAGDGRRVVRPNQATEQRGRDAGGDYLYVLDRETQDIVKRIMSRQGDDDGGSGASVGVPLSGGGGGGGEGKGKGKGAEGELVVELPAGRRVGLPELQRHRRAFMGLNRGGIGLEKVTNMGADSLRVSFVNYLNHAFEQGS